MSYDSRFKRRRSLNVSSRNRVSQLTKGSISHLPMREMSDRGNAIGGEFGQQPPMENGQKLDKYRPYIVWGFLVVFGLGLGANLFNLQIREGPKLKKLAGQQQILRSLPFVPRRPIVDRNGDILAIDRPVYTLWAHPRLFQETKGTIAAHLAPLLAGRGSGPEITEGVLLEKFNSAISGIKVVEGLTEERRDRIANLAIDKKLVDGLELIQQQQRFYPQQDLVADVVGYVDSDRIGQAGVEYSQQNLLERTMPSIRYQRSSNGGWIPDQIAAGFVKFDDLQLQITIDSRLQRVARSSLKEQMKKFHGKRGAVIVMDAQNGELLSLVSEPSYDPNQYYNFNLERFKNWVLTDVYEPGSTFKVINIAIALEAGVITPNTIFNDEGQIFVSGWPIANYDYKQAGPRGAVTVTEILQHSSNVGMVHIMEKVKPTAYYNALESLGLGQTTNSDLPFEVPSQLKSKEQFVGSRVEAATTAFGQGFSLTALQLVQLCGILANDGKKVTPHVVRGLFSRDGQPFWELQRPIPKQIFSPEKTKLVLEMMEKVVQDGTGKEAQIPGYRIAGKTGTAQKANSKGGYAESANVASFVGILPVESPRYVVFAVIDEPQGGTGGVVAAPVVKSVMEALISLEKIPPGEKLKSQEYSNRQGG
ncbi:cell division protein FtsI [Oscillatoriales cyanobacterium USR001]|nr:cell division protein FtsI [Oscillatoriales cyanobacterium USR001]